MTELATSLIAGDTWSWDLSDSDYPAPAWTVTYYFENRLGTFSVAGSASGSDHAITIAAATTTGYKAGKYRWRARATDGTTVTTIASGWLEVEVNPAAAGQADVRSWAQKTLEAVEATLMGRATNDQLSMSIAGRSISRIALPDLMQLRDRLRAEVRAEEQAEKAGLGRNIRARFARV